MRREELFGLPITPLPDIDTAMRLVERASHSGTGLLVTFVNPFAWRIARTRPDKSPRIPLMSRVIGMTAAKNSASARFFALGASPADRRLHQADSHER